jgi:hypothetical protein
MPIHDAFARRTPFELLLPGAGFADERFPAIRAEGEERGVDLGDPARFALLSEAGAVLRDIRGEEEDAQLIQQHGFLLFHAFHFWKEGQPLFLAEVPVVRFLVDSGPGEGEWTPSIPGKAGYVQLPQHLFWTAGGEEEPPESLDGFFWSSSDEENVTLLITMGLRKDRPGFGVVPLPTIPVSAAGEWAAMPVRERGTDFQSFLPGAELEGLYSLEAGAEALKLAMLLFWYLDSFPGCVGEGVTVPMAEEGEGSEESEGPEPSALDYRRIILKES